MTFKVGDQVTVLLQTNFRPRSCSSVLDAKEAGTLRPRWPGLKVPRLYGGCPEARESLAPGHYVYANPIWNLGFL